jgi:hypothetical protein
VTLLAGIDLSSRALHAALVPADDTDTSLPPVTFRCVELPRFKAGATTAQYRSVERCRAVRAGVRELLEDVTTELAGGLVVVGRDDVTSVWVEEPMGARNYATNVLRELYGAVRASIPSHIERAAIAPREWRRELGFDHGYTKYDGIGYAVQWCRDRGVNLLLDEHYAEALCVALAGRALTHHAVNRKGAA